VGRRRTWLYPKGELCGDHGRDHGLDCHHGAYLLIGVLNRAGEQRDRGEHSGQFAGELGCRPAVSGLVLLMIFLALVCIGCSILFIGSTIAVIGGAHPVT
jgi:hypothetical protein